VLVCVIMHIIVNKCECGILVEDEEPGCSFVATRL
jgi:hypothetical protein